MGEGNTDVSESVVSSLPPEPLDKETVEKLTDSDAIHEVMPVFGGMVNPAAFGEQIVPGFVILLDSDAVAVALDPDDEQWKVIARIERDATDDKLGEGANTAFKKLREELSIQSGFGA